MPVMIYGGPASLIEVPLVPMQENIRSLGGLVEFCDMGMPNALFQRLSKRLMDAGGDTLAEATVVGRQADDHISAVTVNLFGEP
jgi:hypothetical protein